MTCYVCGQIVAPVGVCEGVTYSTCVERCCLQCDPQPCRYPDEADRELWRGGRNGEQALAQRWKLLASLPGVIELVCGRGAGLLDYGCGLGQWLAWLQQRQVPCVGYDPWTAGQAAPPLGSCGAATMIEVAEHLGPDLRRAFAWLGLEKLLPGGVLLVQTQPWQGEKPESWWYANPKAGHISLLSHAGLERLGRQVGLVIESRTSDTTVLRKAETDAS